MKLSDFHALYINLNKDEERKEAIECDLNTHSIGFNRVAAVYGKHLKNPIKSAKIAKTLGVDPEKMTAEWWLSRKNFKTMTPYSATGAHADNAGYANSILAKVGCFLSHMKAVQLALQLGLNKVMILEDDAKIDNDFDLNIPDDCDVYYLGGYWWKKEGFEPYNDENVLIDHKFFKIAGAYALILPTRKAMIDVFNVFRSVFLPGKGRDTPKDWRSGKVRLRANVADIHYVNFFQKFGKCYISNPPVVFTRPFQSNINDNRKRYSLSDHQF